MNKTEFGESAIGHSSSFARKVQVYEHFLQQIADLKGMCIYGTADLHDASDEVKDAFREGSYKAYNECADLALAALNSNDLKSES